MLKGGLKAKSIVVFKVMQIILDWIGVDSFLFHPVVPEIFCLKFDVKASNILNFYSFNGNPDINSRSIMVVLLAVLGLLPLSRVRV